MKDEKTIYDNEKTQYQSQNEEATQLDDSQVKNGTTPAGQETKPETEQADKAKWKGTAARVAASFGTGILLGAASTLFSGSAPIESNTPDEPAKPENQEGQDGPDMNLTNGGEIAIASSVNDDMSFSQAYAAARTELGAGGAFVWHGNVYSTYTAEEWGGMTQEEREEYGSHVNYGHAHSSASAQAQTQTQDEVEVVSAHTGNEQTAQVQETHNGGQEEVNVTVVESDPVEVEILGVVHDDESGANIGGMMVDGQEFVLIDVDGDSTFDVMATDIDGDNQISENEVVDISAQHLTVNDMGGFSSPEDPSLASNSNEIDYTNDSGVYGG